MFEIEVKIELNEKQDLQSILGEATKVGEKHEVDDYFDFKGIPLYKKHAFLRIRDHKKLNLKYFPTQGTHIAREHEYYFSKPDSTQLQAIAEYLGFASPVNALDELGAKKWLEENALKPLMTIEKKRTRYKDDKYAYDVDEVEKLGKYVEIEVEANTLEEAEKAKNELARLVKLRGWKIFENKGYVHMYVEKYLPELLK